jgi:SAM-dependent methyltransferase
MANEEQIRVWNELNAERWIRLREPTVRPLVPFGEAALAALAPRPGESALDVGCGFGDMTVALAKRTGNALGVDVCEPFLRVATSEAAHGARYLLADAQTFKFVERFELCFSRFGVMFFADPAAAFANLHSAMNPGGRFAAVAWGPWQQNEWTALPLEIVRKHLPAPEPAPGPGPYGLSQPGLFERFLKGAGFQKIRLQQRQLPFDADAAQLMQQGPASAFLRSVDASPRLREQITAELSEAMNGRRLGATVLLATAEA